VLYLIEDVENEKSNKTLGEVFCTTEDLILWRGNKLVLNLKPHLTTEDFLAQGWITIYPLDPIKYQAPKVAGVLPVCPRTSAKFESVYKDYRYISLPGHPVKFREILREAPLLFVIVFQYLDLLIREEKAIVQQYDSYTFPEPQVENTRRQRVAFHLSLIGTYESHSNLIAKFGTEKRFRSSVMKKEDEVQFLPINCHIHELIVDEGGGNGELAAHPFSSSLGIMADFLFL